MAQLGGERVHKEERWLNGSVSDSNAVVPGSIPVPPPPRAGKLCKSLGGLVQYRIVCWPLRGGRSTKIKQKTPKIQSENAKRKTEEVKTCHVKENHRVNPRDCLTSTDLEKKKTCWLVGLVEEIICWTSKIF
jgi:hypothetical protein